MLLDGLPFDEHNNGLLQGASIWTFDKILRALGISATGGSTSTRNIAEPIRACAASALDMLMRAATEKFGVAAGQLEISDGHISAPNGKSVTYAELADAAAKLSPKTIRLPPLAAGTSIAKAIAPPEAPP